MMTPSRNSIESDIYFKLEILKKSINFVILLITLFAFKNVLIVAVGALISEMVSTIINIPANRKLFAYKYADQFKDLKSTILISIIMFFCVYYVGHSIKTPITSLVVQVLVGGIIYIMLSVLFKNDNFYYTKDIIIGVLKRRE